MMCTGPDTACRVADSPIARSAHCNSAAAGAVQWFLAPVARPAGWDLARWQGTCQGFFSTQT